MAGRKVPDDIQGIFDRYIGVNFVRRLKKDKAIEMFKKEFNLNEERAEFLFDTFDQDKNGQLSIWEFYHFYTAFGGNANKYLDEFDCIQCDGKATDLQKVQEFLAPLETLSGKTKDIKECEKLVHDKAGEAKTIDKKQFAELIWRIKTTRN